MADTKALVRASPLYRKDTNMLGSNPNLLHQKGTFLIPLAEKSGEHRMRYLMGFLN